MGNVRVLHIVTHMNLGGLETMLMNYYRKINREKIQFDFLVHRAQEAYYDKEIEALGGKIFRISRLNPFSASYKNELKEFFLSHPEYKIIHVHQDCLSGVVLKVAKDCGITFRIAHSHSSSQDKNFKYFIKLFYKRYIPKYATHLFACGEKAGNWMFGSEKFEILNNAIDTTKYTYSLDKRISMRKNLKIDDSKFVIGHVGRFSDAKNHSFLLDIFSKICKKQDALLMLVGGGELRSEIEQKVKSLGIYNKVQFLGLRNDVCDIMQAMDVFVFPSKYEGFPVTLVEAQASGLPCLISQNISSEVIKTDLVQQLSLDVSADVWAENALNLQFFARENTLEEMKSSGYDITENACYLEKFYNDLLEVM